MISIDGRPIGSEHPPYVIAELSANHQGSLDKAKATISAARECGADAIKLQTYTPETMTIRSQRDDFMIHEGLWRGYTLYDLYEWAHTPFEWHAELFAHARSEGLSCFSSPFDETAVDLLASLDAPAYKIASFEATDLPLVEYAAARGKPLIISTGMANRDEIEDVAACARAAGCRELIMLHCTSSYPTPMSAANLRSLPALAKLVDAPVGLSDHTPGHTAAVAAVALGACVIEKHFTLSRAEPTPDAAFSLEPDELRALVEQTRAAWEALGEPAYGPTDVESANIKFRRSVYVVRDVPAGQRIVADDIRRIRPGYGLAPKHAASLIGRRAAVDISAGTAADLSLFKD